MCYLTLLYSCPLCLQMTCAGTPQRGGLAAKHFHKGAQRQREMRAEQTNACAHCVWEAQEFQCQTLCDQSNSVWVQKLTRPGSGTFLSWSESCWSRWHSVCQACGWTQRGPLWENSGQADRPASWRVDSQHQCWERLLLRWKLPKPSPPQRQRGRAKTCFHFRWRHVLCLLKIQTYFLDLNQMLHVMWTPSVSALVSVSNSLSFLLPRLGSANWRLVAASAFHIRSWQSLVQ